MTVAMTVAEPIREALRIPRRVPRCFVPKERRARGDNKGPGGTYRNTRRTAVGSRPRAALPREVRSGNRSGIAQGIDDGRFTARLMVAGNRTNERAEEIVVPGNLKIVENSVNLSRNVDILVCPPATLLELHQPGARLARAHPGLPRGGRGRLHRRPRPEMLKDAGAGNDHIVGRRSLDKETDGEAVTPRCGAPGRRGSC